MRIDSDIGRRFVWVAKLIGVSVLVTSSLYAGGLSGRVGAIGETLKLTLRHNIAPVPNFNSSGYGHAGPSGSTTYPNPCVVTSRSGEPIFVVNARSVACTNYVLEAINRAHRAEGVRTMALPTNWYRLSPQQQLFVVADLERVDRGLAPYLGINSALAATAQRGAVLAADPGVAAGFALKAMGANWAGANSVLEADYGWMYEDGWAGARLRTSNIDCTSARAAACWGHREVILGHFTGLGCTTCELGTGYAPLGRSSGSYTELIETPAGPAPAMVFTWAHDVAPFLSVATTTTSTTTTSFSPSSTMSSSVTPN